jgi:hypothetical protein
VVVTGCYLAASAGLAAWWLFGQVVLWWVARAARPVSRTVRDVLIELAGPGGKRVALLRSDRIALPVTFTWARPVILLPSAFCDRADRAVLRYALAHEWSHVERRDAWAWNIVCLTGVVLCYQPLYWWLRHQLRLCQDFLADERAAAAGTAEGYAETLVRLARSRGPGRAVPALGVVDRRSNLYRRVVMLVGDHEPLERRCQTSWSLAAFAAAAVVVVASSGLRLDAAPPAGDARAKGTVVDKQSGKTTTENGGVVRRPTPEPWPSQAVPKTQQTTEARELRPAGSVAERAEAVARLVSLIRKHPPRLSEAAFRRDRLMPSVALRISRPPRLSEAAFCRRLYVLDLETGEVNLVADEPDPGLSICGSPDWSPDGRFLVFDAMPAGAPPPFHLTHIKKVEAGEHGLRIKDLGLGNVPAVVPEGDRIVFLLNPGAVKGAEPGLFLMQADGTRRIRLGGFARPKISPDGRQMLLVAFTDLQRLSIIELATGKLVPLDLGGRQSFSTPTWAGPNKLIAVTGTDAPDTLAMLDVKNPYEVKSESLFTLGEGERGREIHYPLHRTEAGRSIFVVAGPEGRTMLSIARGQKTPTVVLPPIPEPITDPALSPDGRYVLFSSKRRALRWTAKERNPGPSETMPTGL